MTRLTKAEKAALRSCLRACRFKVGSQIWSLATPSTAWQCFAGWRRPRDHREGLRLLQEWEGGQACM